MNNLNLPQHRPKLLHAALLCFAMTALVGVVAVKCQDSTASDLYLPPVVVAPPAMTGSGVVEPASWSSCTQTLLACADDRPDCNRVTCTVQTIDADGRITTSRKPLPVVTPRIERRPISPSLFTAAVGFAASDLVLTRIGLAWQSPAFHPAGDPHWYVLRAQEAYPFLPNSPVWTPVVGAALYGAALALAHHYQFSHPKLARFTVQNVLLMGIVDTAVNVIMLSREHAASQAIRAGQYGEWVTR